MHNPESRIDDNGLVAVGPQDKSWRFRNEDLKYGLTTAAALLVTATIADGYTRQAPVALGIAVTVMLFSP